MYFYCILGVFILILPRVASQGDHRIAPQSRERSLRPPACRVGGVPCRAVHGWPSIITVLPSCRRSLRVVASSAVCANLSPAPPKRRSSAWLLWFGFNLRRNAQGSFWSLFKMAGLWLVATTRESAFFRGNCPKVSAPSPMCSPS